MRCYTSRSVQTAASLIFVAAPINHERVLQMNISSFLNHLNGIRILALPLCLCLVFGSTLLSTIHSEAQSVSEGVHPGLSVSETGSDETVTAANGTETGSDEAAQVPIPADVAGKTGSDETAIAAIGTDRKSTRLNS